MIGSGSRRIPRLQEQAPYVVRQRRELSVEVRIEKGSSKRREVVRETVRDGRNDVLPPVTGYDLARTKERSAQTPGRFSISVQFLTDRVRDGGLARSSHSTKPIHGSAGRRSILAPRHDGLDDFLPGAFHTWFALDFVVGDFLARS